MKASQFVKKKKAADGDDDSAGNKLMDWIGKKNKSAKAAAKK